MLSLLFLNCRSLDSPSISLEAVSGPQANNAQVRILGESDPETETLPEPNEWTINVSDELIAKLSASERKRQDVFNGTII